MRLQNSTPEELIPRALDGDLKALESILASVKDQIFNLSIRFLWHPADAEDACQEILVKIMLNLNRFEFRSAFSTWTYRIAMNYLIDAKRSRLERLGMEFSMAQQEIARAASLASNLNQNSAEVMALSDETRLVHEVKTACSHAMLQCLDRNGRAAFILGEGFGMDSRDAAFVLNISPEAYRQRLSRARKTMDRFLNSNCGLKNTDNPYRCEKRACQVQSSSMLRRYLAYSSQLPIHEKADLPDSLDRLAWIYRSNTRYIYRNALLDRVRRHLQSSQV